MQKAIIESLLCFVIMLTVVGLIRMENSTETKAVEITITPKQFLMDEIERQGLPYRDFRILNEIIRCESSWSQTWERDYNGHIKGEVKVSNGNIGLMQINRTAHHDEYEKLGLNPFDPFDNIKYGIILYKRNVVRDWEKWSGHCWKPALAKKNIIIK